MGRFKFILVVLCINSCTTEQAEVPEEVIYASRHDPFVYNLKRIDPQISSKSVEISAPMHGTIRLVNNNTYLIYDPDVRFDAEVLSFQIDGEEKFRLRLVESQAGCVPLARSFKFDISTQSPLINQELFTFFCEENLISRVSSYTIVTPLEGAEFISSYSYPPLNFSFDFIFTPQEGITGMGEIIYEVGADEMGFSGQAFEAEQYVAGLVRVNVIE